MKIDLKKIIFFSMATIIFILIRQQSHFTEPNYKNIEIISYNLVNKHGYSVEILNLGGIISSIKTPDRSGVFKDITLGFTSPKQYLDEHPYFGAIVGRFANRIANGKFEIEGKEYILAQNNGLNHLHGGALGFDNVFWEVDTLENENGIQLSYISADGEEGYPGNLSVTVTYILTDDNTLKVNYEAQTDKTTVINLTQHSYFNLSGDFSKQILDHELQLFADSYLPVDNTQIPTGSIQLVADSPFDFRARKEIGKDIDIKNNQLEIGKGYDHC
ncbi:MAG: galactose mutarotase, partial [Flavobacteriales bacterium]